MVRPVVWWPPAEPSPAEQAVIKAVRRAKLFVFLRLHRHELFDEQFQAELAEAYVDSPKGQPPVPPAQLALATILQAYTGVSDDEVIEATVMDRRWQVVLDCLDCTDGAPFSTGTLVAFRERLISARDRRLIERTGGDRRADEGVRAPADLRAALDSSTRCRGRAGRRHVQSVGTCLAQSGGYAGAPAGAGVGPRQRGRSSRGGRAAAGRD